MRWIPLFFLSGLLSAAEPSRLILIDGRVMEPVRYYPDEGRVVMILDHGTASKNIDPAMVDRIIVLTSEELAAVLEPGSAPIPRGAPEPISQGPVPLAQMTKKRLASELSELETQYNKAIQMLNNGQASDARLAQEWPVLQQQNNELITLSNQLIPQITAAQDRWNQEVDLYGPRRLVRTTFNPNGRTEGGPLPATETLVNTLNAQRDDLLKRSAAIVKQMDANTAQRQFIANGAASIQRDMAVAAEKIKALQARLNE